jgi:hypothetical protein
MNCSCLKLGTIPSCSTCRFGFCLCCTYPNDIECHRHAPIRTTDDELRRAIWPRVPRSAICGDYELDRERAAADHEAELERVKFEAMQPLRAELRRLRDQITEA